MRGIARLGSVAAGVVLAAGLLPAPAARASILIVTKTADTLDGNCDSDCSLREAIALANTSFTLDEIRLSSAVYTLRLTGPGALAPNTDTVIAGTGHTTIRGKPGWATRIFDSSATLTLRDLTVTGGNVPDTALPFFENGGGIRSQGNLVLDGVAVSDNNAGDQGGGIFQTNAGTLTITDSTISDNTSVRGGGIFTQGSTTISSSSIADNVASTGSGVGGGLLTNNHLELEEVHVYGNTAQVGGGLYLDQPVGISVNDSFITGNSGIGGGGGIWNANGIINLSDTTISSNIAGGGGGVVVSGGQVFLVRDAVLENRSPGAGGGLFVIGGSLDVIDSTVSGNEADADGGALRMNAGTTNIMRSTIAENIADADGNNGASQDGGGIGLLGTGVVNMKASILADNIDSSPGVVITDCSSGFTSQGYNVVGDPTGCTYTPTTGDTTGDPQLGPLTSNGGPSPTYAIGAASLAHDRNDDDIDCGIFDQRHAVRPLDEDCDSGAYELVLCDGFAANVIGTGASDKLTGTLGDDSVLAGAGDDTISTFEGNDHVCAGKGNDKLIGGTGDDRLFGEKGKDKLIGDEGSDLLDGGPGDPDTCKGGPDPDTFVACEIKK